MDDSQKTGDLGNCCIMSNPEMKKYTKSSRRRQVLDVDLNAAPPCESRDQDVIPDPTRPQSRQESEGNITLPQPIDVEALDDDVIIASPTAFAEAKNNSRKNRGRTIVVDVDNEERASRNKRRRVPKNQTIINCDRYINLESDSDSMRKSEQSAAIPLAPPVPVEATFSCPVCLEACIKAAIAAQGKCPTCRRKTTNKDIIRVYLPATRSA